MKDVEIILFLQEALCICYCTPVCSVYNSIIHYYIRVFSRDILKRVNIGMQAGGRGCNIFWKI